MLNLSFSAEEIKNALWSIPDDKAPGLDGYNSKFFKVAWSIVGKDVVTSIQDFFATGKLLKSWNITSVTLVPKVPCRATPGDFRPISCCHVLYKCISKLICSRLSSVLGFLINQAQGAFVANRSILHNVLLCQDVVKHYSRKYCLSSCLLETDLRKAYDTMDWNFIRDMLVALQFPPHFTNIVMISISSIKYSLLLNGCPMEAFAARRGLRQGDPMSPLLFVIGMEYLSRSLVYESMLHSFGFHPRCKRSKLTHLCFADDLMLFCKADLSSIRALVNCLDSFSQSFGLIANSAKSAIYAAGVSTQLGEAIAASTQFSLGKLPFRYLGVPLSSKRLSVADCEVLVDKMTSRIKVWNAKSLSYAARLQLVNSVLMSISSYWC